jgi:hypothetical protein
VCGGYSLMEVKPLTGASRVHALLAADMLY